MQVYILQDIHDFAIYHPHSLGKIQQNNNNSMKDRTQQFVEQYM